MFALKVKIHDHWADVRKAAERATLRNLYKAGAYIRKVARSSIKRKGAARKEPKGEKARQRWRQEKYHQPASPPGTPPYTHVPQGLKESIFFQVEKQAENVVAGPTRAAIDTLGQLHEFGGRRHKRRYPARPFMGPALEKTQEAVPDIWAGSVRK